MSVTISGSGQIIKQVVSSTYGTYPTTTTSASWVSTGHTLTITPTSSSSKILLINTAVSYRTAGTTQFTIFRNGTNLGSASYGLAENNSTFWTPICMSYLDSPATTSATTYTVYYLQSSGTAYYCGNPGELCSLTALEVSGS